MNKYNIVLIIVSMNNIIEIDDLMNDLKSFSQMTDFVSKCSFPIVEDFNIPTYDESIFIESIQTSINEAIQEKKSLNETPIDSVSCVSKDTIKEPKRPKIIRQCKYIKDSNGKMIYRPKRKYTFKSKLTKQSSWEWICSHGTQRNACFICKNNGRCLHNKIYERCLPCKEDDLRIINICKVEDCFNRSIDVIFDGLCISCHKSINPDKFKKFYIDNVYDYVERNLRVMGEINVEPEIIDITLRKGMKYHVKFYNMGIFLLILEVNDYKFTSYDRNYQIVKLNLLKKIYAFKYYKIVFIKLNSGECTIHSHSLETKMLYTEDDDEDKKFSMNAFWYKDTSTGEVKLVEPKEQFDANVSSFNTRIISVAMLINSYKRIIPQQEITLHELYY